MQKRNRTKVIKLAAPFENLKIYSSPEEALFKAIIAQALIDISTLDEIDSGISSVIKKNANEAKNWIYSNDEYFQIICEGASLSPSFVKKIAQESIRLQKEQANNLEKRQRRRSRKKTINFGIPELLNA